MSRAARSHQHNGSAHLGVLGAGALCCAGAGAGGADRGAGAGRGAGGGASWAGGACRAGCSRTTSGARGAGAWWTGACRPGERAARSQEGEPGPWEPERPARVIRARSAAAVALAAPVSLCGLAAQDSSPAELDCPGAAPSPRAHAPPKGRVQSLVPVRLAAARRDSANQPSAGSPRAPPKDRGPFPAPCCPVRAWAFPAIGRCSAVHKRAPAKVWVR
jgi:hypothetical protein